MMIVAMTFVLIEWLKAGFENFEFQQPEFEIQMLVEVVASNCSATTEIA